MNGSNFPDNITAFIGTVTSIFMAKGATREVAILARSRIKAEQTDYDNLDGGIYGYCVYFEIPTALYSQINEAKAEIEQRILDTAAP